MIKKLLVSLSGFFLLAILGLALVAPSFAKSTRPDFAEDEIIIQLKQNQLLKDLENINQKFGTKLKTTLSFPDTLVLKVPKGQVEKFTKLYSLNPIIEYAEPNYTAEALFTPNDAYFGNQWGMTKVQAPQAWDLSTGSANIKIAILDTGIDEDHEDLAAKVVTKINMTTSPTTNDLFGHGTHVSGIAAAITDNEKGVAGLGFNTSLVNVKVLDDSGSGYYSWIANGVKWAADNGVKVINLSLGGSSSSRTLQRAIDYAWNKGVVLSCAAGNNGNTQRLYPAYYTNCIAVAATDKNDQKASFSTYGFWVDVAAPGVDIFSSFPNHPFYIGTNYGRSENYDYGSGTSMATPHVAGLAALVSSQFPTFSNAQIRNKIESTADKITGTGTYWAKGRINAYKAVSN